jgi:hypothetical protein
MKKGILFMMASILLLGGVSCKKKGCMDPLANNYNDKAKKDNGTCDYTPKTYEAGNITTNTTFTDKNIKICDNISVSAGLTIPAGTTIIMCAGASIEVTATGYINAIGTATEPIIIKGETETPGFWEGLSIKSNNPNNVLTYVTVKDAGTYWGWEYAGVFIGDNAKVSISNSTISNHQNTALYFHDNAQIGTFSNNTFANSDLGLSLPSKLIGKIDGGSNYNSSNVKNYIEGRAATITSDQTWPKTSTPILSFSTSVQAALTITAGSTIMFEANNGLLVEASGSLTAVGTATEPIVIKGRYSSPGYWDGISIVSNNPNNKIKFTTVSDGGQYWAYEYAGIEVEGRLDLDNSTVSNSNSYGVYVHNTAQLFTSGVVQSTVTGVEASNTFTNNGTGANANCTSGCKVYFQP